MREEEAVRAAGNVTRMGQLQGCGGSPGGVPSLPAKSTSQNKAPTLAILLLLSAVRNDMLLISFWTTKFCSSRLKFWWGRKCEKGSDSRGGEGRASQGSRFSGKTKRVEKAGGTHVGLGPVDEDLAHHPEQLLGTGVRLCQPVGPGG